jgi:hypothetical protein
VDIGDDVIMLHHLGLSSSLEIMMLGARQRSYLSTKSF